MRLVDFATGFGGFNDGGGQLNQYVPTDLVQLDNGNWLVATLGGPVRLVSHGGSVLDSAASPFLLLPTAVGGFGNELNFGTTAVELHPDFLNQSTAGYGKLFALVTRPQSDNLSVDFGFGSSHFDRLVEYTADDPTSNNPNWTSRVVMTIQQPAPIHNLFDLDFGPDGYLYGSFGDGGGDGATSQDRTTILGDVIRINPFDPNGTAPSGEKLSHNGEYSIPLDNPLVGLGGGAVEEAWSYGLRSPFTLNFSNNGELYVGDVGEGQREEVSRIAKNSNQGWNGFEGTRTFILGTSLVPGTTHNPPVFEYTHAEGRSVIGGFVYDGNFFPKLRGKFVFGDFQGQTEEQETPIGRLFYGDLVTDEIFEFNLDALGLQLSGISILNIGQDAQGELYIATSVASTAEQAPADPDGGAIFRLVPVDGGDYNKNGAVDAADYVVWRRTLGSTSNLQADGDFSGIIDDGDYQVWSSNFGQTIPSELRAEVDLTTGNVTVVGGTVERDVRYYEITSDSGSLEPSGWYSFEQRILDMISTADGDHWDELVGSDTMLAEAFLNGSSLFDENRIVDLGDIFKTGSPPSAQDLEFTVVTTDLEAFPVAVTYVSQPVTLVQVAEPQSVALSTITLMWIGCAGRRRSVAAQVSHIV